jgi:4-hydroxythreonine-4-phosphate dehydrogenase
MTGTAAHTPVDSARSAQLARPRPIAITMGDAAGIGPEIVAKAFRDAPQVVRGCFVAGDLATMRRATQAIRGQGVGFPLP